MNSKHTALNTWMGAACTRRGHGGTGSLVNRKLDVCAARRALEGIGRGHRKLHGVRPKTRFVSAEFFTYKVLQHVIFVLHIGEQF
jgi:hypothetical protein